jgi:regulator of protease activity HflC (stomatin/prohibitin superfamily)
MSSIIIISIESNFAVRQKTIFKKSCKIIPLLKIRCAIIGIILLDKNNDFTCEVIMSDNTILVLIFLFPILFFIFLVLMGSLRRIGPTEVGLVTKRFSFKKLVNDNPIAFNGEPGYQADLLMPGLRWKSALFFKVEKFPWVQIPAGQIGVVISQVGKPLPIGAKSAVYKKEFGNFSDLTGFVTGGGEKGVQRIVLPPGSLIPIHPVGFLVITKNKVYGLPVSPEHESRVAKDGLKPEAFGLEPHQLEIIRIEPSHDQDGKGIDMIGIVTTFEGTPLPSGDLCSRLGGFEDLDQMEKAGAEDAKIIETILGSKNIIHNNYQDFQEFLDKGGKLGLQHDPLLYGAYALNPFLIQVELVPMLIINQGQVAVIKAYVGLPTQDTSGAEFKYGSLVKPGHRGVWQEPLRTGKYAINPHCYRAELVPTAILTLNWADTVSQAHNLDKQLKQITAKSKEGFVFSIDLQVQIHVADTKAPRVISMVGTIQNLVNEVLQAAVGNHFRNTIQSMPAIRFIETRQHVQEDALEHISRHIEQYQVETKGIYIQDVILPEGLVTVLTEREIANQQIETYKRQKESQDQRIDMEHAKGTADMQAALSKSKVDVEIKTNTANARKAEAEGEATFIRQTGSAKGAEVESIGLAKAKGFKAQVEAVGANATAMVNIATALSESKTRFVPDIFVSGGNGSGMLEGLAARLMGVIGTKPSGVNPFSVSTSNGQEGISEEAADHSQKPEKIDNEPIMAAAVAKLGEE